MHLLIITRKVDCTDTRMGFFWDWIVEFSKHVTHLSVICLEKGTIDGLPENCSVYSMGKEQGRSRTKELLRYLWHLIRLIPRCSGVFVFMIPLYAVIAGPCTKIFRKKMFLWHTHAIYDHTFNSKLLWFTQVWVNGYISASQESFPLPTGKKVFSFGHALNLKKFPFLSSRVDADKKLVLMTVGRIAPVKNLEILIEAVHILKIRHVVDVSCEILGIPALEPDKGYAQKLRELAEERRLQKEIIFFGSVPHERLTREFIHADIFINLSSTNSLDKAILEPMASGVLVLTSNASMPPIFGDLAPLLMVKPRDVEDLVQKILRLWRMKHEEKERIRRKLRRIVEKNHDMENTIPKIIALYQ